MTTERHRDDGTTRLPASLRLFVLTSSLLTLISLASSWVARLAGLSLPYTYPYIFVPGNFYSDYREMLPQVSLLGTPAFLHQRVYFMYPPAMLLPFAALYKLHAYGKAFSGLLLLAGAGMTLLFYRILRRHHLEQAHAALFVAAVVITSYPYLLLLQRSNIEVLPWVLSSVGVWAFYGRRYGLTAICFGLATALKLYPFVLFALLLPRHRFKEVALGVATAALATLLGLRIISPDLLFALRWSSTQLQAFGHFYAGGSLGLSVDHSLLALVKMAMIGSHPDLTWFVPIYMRIVAVLCLGVYFLRIWRLPVANQILILSILSVTIPPVSFDYTLLSLYAPFAVLCVLALTATPAQDRALVPYFLLFALIFTPESYLYLHGARWGGPFRALCLLVMVGWALWQPLLIPSQEEPAASNDTTLLPSPSPSS